jgi:hypothetical protein
LEEARSVLNAVGLSGLEVWVGIHSDPVDGVDDGLVRSVDPSSPGVNVTDGGSAQRSTSNGSSNLSDVGGEGSRISTISRLGSDTSGGDAVEILRANRDTSNKVCELGAIC